MFAMGWIGVAGASAIIILLLIDIDKVRPAAARVVLSGTPDRGLSSSIKGVIASFSTLFRENRDRNPPFDARRCTFCSLIKSLGGVLGGIFRGA